MLTSIETVQEIQTTSFDFAPGLEAAFPGHFEEQNCIVKPDSPLPDFVRGTYYLNGPARFGFHDLKYRHWLDGDGMVAALRFEQDSIHLTSRYIRSRKFVEEQNAGQPLFRTFGTSFDNSRLNRAGNGLESPVNVSVYPFGKSLLAFGEQGLPWELDPVTLETRGQFTFNKRLNDASPFSAHPKFDPETGEIFNFGIFFSTHAPRLYFYCFGPEGLRYRKPIILDYPCSVHDFSLSRNYAIFYLSPYLLDVNNLLQNNGTVMDSLNWKPELGSRILVLARKTGKIAASISVGNRYCLHLINSFEQDRQLVVDVLEFDGPIYGQYEPLPDIFSDIGPGGPVRLVIDLQSGELSKRLALDYLQAPDFPAVDPRRVMQPYGDFWMLGISAAGRNGRKFFDQLAHANWNRNTVSDIYQAPAGCYLGGEPVFVGDSNSDNGVVICQEFDTRHGQSYFLLFDAHSVSHGPITRIALQRVFYLGFHAVFQPTTGVLEGRR
ncbi:MAG TPA: carotenoid oxygenase family protein [Candidatus Angelobacter sp.]|jgi:carotenoid cleavage dioxygenase-like enzyme|nr:carotenoid oxygenase family protein [Candidatus Angelobacter sp.]